MNIPGKIEITQRIFQLVEGLPYDLDQARLLWWYNIRPSGGLRLRKEGFDCFNLAEIESWNITVEKSELTKKFIIDLDRRLTCPYFIAKDRIFLFGNREAVMALLHGSMTRYLSSLRNG